MPESLDLDDILAHNPHVSREQLEAAEKMLQRLRERGLSRKGYDLAPRNVGLRTPAKRAFRTDPRVIRLTCPDDE